MKDLLYRIILATIFILVLSACGKSYQPTEKIQLPSVFSENMVLQAGKKIKIWGNIDPLSEVKIWIEGNNESAVSDSNGKFSLVLDVMEYGGPHSLYAAGKDTMEIKNVMVGEVWLCSGQSNMQWTVSQSNNAESEIEAADFKDIRLFTVPRVVSDKPEEDCNSSWTECDPKTVGSFSAVAYYFGRELFNNLNVPIGLIHSSWGGTPIESWMKYQTLENDSDFVPIIQRHRKNLEEYPEKLKEYNELVKKIESEGLILPEVHKDKENKGVKNGWTEKSFNDQKWKDVDIPGFVETFSGQKIDGAFWFRKEVEIPSNFIGRDLVVELGAIDDFDITYFNGYEIGFTDENTPQFWTIPRVYNIPSNNISENNTIAVRIFDHYGEGGFTGAPSQMKIYPKDDPADIIEISGNRKFKVETALDPNNITGPGSGNMPSAPLGPGHPYSPAGLFNAMIEPVAPYTLQGYIWYQGEANASRAFQYRKLLPAMINDWRTLWNDNGLYFGIVQLANFMAVQEQPSESAWAELREAQYMASKNDPLAGLAVAIDIGEADDIHPRNKQDVGNRLAFWALNRCYGAESFNNGSATYSGPTFKDIKFADGKAFVTFNHIGEGLESRNGEKLKGFAIAGKEKQYVWADARIDGNKVIVWNSNIKEPLAVRYAWANNPICNLYNSVGLPAAPFRTDNWKGITHVER